MVQWSGVGIEVGTQKKEKKGKGMEE